MWHEYFTVSFIIVHFVLVVVSEKIQLLVVKNEHWVVVVMSEFFPSYRR